MIGVVAFVEDQRGGSARRGEPLLLGSGRILLGEAIAGDDAGARAQLLAAFSLKHADRLELGIRKGSANTLRRRVAFAEPAGRPTYPKAKSLLITADCGESVATAPGHGRQRLGDLPATPGCRSSSRTSLLERASGTRSSIASSATSLTTGGAGPWFPARSSSASSDPPRQPKASACARRLTRGT